LRFSSALYKYDPGIAEGMIRLLFPAGFQYSQLKIKIGKFTSAFVAPSEDFFLKVPPEFLGFG